MIEYPGRIFFSRWEDPRDENDWLYNLAFTLAYAAKDAFLKQFPDDEETWKTWNVMELHGDVIMNRPVLHLVWYKGLGVHPFPEEKRRVIYLKDRHKIKELDINDPFLLHYSHRLVPDDKELEGDPLVNPKDRKRWRRKVEEFYQKLEESSVIYHPSVHQKSGWLNILYFRKIKIVNLPDEKNPTRIDGWDVVEISPHVGWADFSIL